MQWCPLLLLIQIHVEVYLLSVVSILLCSQGWRARDSTFAPSPQTYVTAAFGEGRVCEGANLLWLRCQPTDSSEQSQQASQLWAVNWGSRARRSDNCLGTQHPALSAAGSRGHASCRYSTPPAQYKDDTLYVVTAVFLELLESLLLDALTSYLCCLRLIVIGNTTGAWVSTSIINGAKLVAQQWCIACCTLPSWDFLDTENKCFDFVNKWEWWDEYLTDRFMSSKFTD